MRIILSESDLTNQSSNSDAKNFKLEDFEISLELVWRSSFVAFVNHETCIVFKNRIDGFTGVLDRKNLLNYLETIY